MCAAHRSSRLTDIRARLNRRQACRVVSTQLIEAGVDVDFPVVFRAICGLDSLAQAAGRCNREGRIDIGEVIMFESDKLPPPGFLRQSAQTTRELLPDFDDVLAPDAVEAYFRMRYWQSSEAWDKHRVLASFGSNPNDLKFNFREADKRYQFIRVACRSLGRRWNKLNPATRRSRSIGAKFLAQVAALLCAGAGPRVETTAQCWSRGEETGAVGFVAATLE